MPAATAPSLTRTKTELEPRVKPLPPPLWPRYTARMSEDSPTLPDRLSVNPKSPYYNETLLARGIGIRFKGEEKTNVAEYCVSEGWVRLTIGNKVDRKGEPLTMKFSGPVEPYLKG